jgi:hypothetical protein
MVNVQIRPSRDLQNSYTKIQQPEHQQYIYDELQKSKALLNDPNTEMIPHEEVMARLREQREARNRV